MKNINENERTNEHTFPSHHLGLSEYQMNLARELAESMNDTKSIMQYHKWVKIYSESVLRKFQAQILARSDIQNRGGYFTTLVHTHAYNERHSTRH